jgi:hypothetical protein
MHGVKERQAGQVLPACGFTAEAQRTPAKEIFLCVTSASLRLCGEWDREKFDPLFNDRRIGL